MKTETKVNLGATPPPAQSQELKLPHERDQAVQPDEAVIDVHAKKAAKDAKKGTPDTSRAVEADVAYQRQKRP
jgi:hypothetical protein